jgi:Cu(I)/Ag(I) efflux system membrane fusion protein
MSADADVSPRAMTVMAVVRWALLVAVTAVAGASVYRFWGPVEGRGGAVAAGRYHCPMHPEVVQDSPGTCPICHMDLEPIGAPNGGGGSGGAAHAHASSAPCVEAPTAGDAGVLPTALVPVTMTLDRVQLGGVVSVPVTRGDDDNTLRVAASVEVAETGLAEVHLRTPGFVERVAARETGVTVRAGQVLAWVYAPQLVQVQQELLSALRWREGQSAGGGVGAMHGVGVDAHHGDGVVDAARNNLRLLGMSGADIESVIASRTVMREVPVRAPISGTITRRSAVLGQYAMPETVLYELTDLGRVWVMAHVPDDLLARVRVGQSARFVASDDTGAAPREARVRWIEPTVSPVTRSGRVRFALDNPGHALRPGQRGEVRLTLPGGAATAGALRVPRDAVIDTGDARYVFVDLGEGRFAPRAVRLGRRVEESFLVLEGLRVGERVVARGAFMLDAESRLRGALAAHTTPTDGGAR